MITLEGKEERRKMSKIPAEFNSAKEIKKIFNGAGPVVGVGVSAFQRSGLGYILPNYEILSLLETSDLAAIRKICPVTVIGDLGGEYPQKLNTSSILSLPQVQSWLGKNRQLFVYKAATPLDSIITDLKARLLSAPGYIRKPLEDKKIFRQEASKAGIKIPRGGNFILKNLTEDRWDRLKQELGERLVFQLTDYSTGGGQGTFFINNQGDWQRFWDFTNSENRKKELLFVNVCERLSGRAASITGCATRDGVVTGILQTQIIDQPELTGFRGRSGVWLGHDWNVSFSDKAQVNAEAVCKKWGEHIYSKGYKGIFGLDVVVSPDDSITAIECNSRYTGAFPVYTMVQLSQGEMPLDVWHLLEWLGLDYELDIEAVQQLARRPKRGAHIILHNREDRPVKVGGAVKAGVYSGSDPVRYLRPGFSLTDLKSDAEFVLCDRIPKQGQTVKIGERVGKLIFKRRIVDDRGNLLPEIKATVEAVYAASHLTA